MASGRLFGNRNEPHTFIIARGERVRHFTLGSSALCLSALIALGLGVGMIAAPALYLLDNEAKGDGGETEWRIVQSYERRISDLRAQLDQATSRRFLSEKMIETKVDVLLDQQEELATRYDKLAPLFERARDSGMIADVVPVPAPRPASNTASSDQSQVVADRAPFGPASAFASVDGDISSVAIDALDEMRTGSVAVGEAQSGAVPAYTASDLRAGLPNADTLSDETVSQIANAMDTAEWKQITGLRELAAATRAKAVRIAAALESVGVRIPSASGTAAEGGPFEPVGDDRPPTLDTAFDESYAELDAALLRLDDVKSATRAVPLTEPMSPSLISSRFGVRADPFLGRRAIHSGIDYAVPRGTPIKAQAPGTVVFAGPRGGYGNMVEIDHGNGFTTRFAHMSAITIRKGSKVDAGTSLGFVGSTGRSTGPHLHYEIKLNGKAIDPARLYRIAEKVADAG